MIKKYTVLFAMTLALTGYGAAAFADYEDGVNAALAGDFTTALREFTLAAEQGMAMAQFNLAILYFTGQGVEQDYASAYRWTRAAAEQGHVEAQANLGSLYMTGDGVERNAEAAMNWFAAAASRGHGASASTLAKFYDEGKVVERDRVLAHAWAAMAEFNGAEDGPELKRRIETRLSAAELSAARRQFARWQIQPPPTPYSHLELEP